MKKFIFKTASAFILYGPRILKIAIYVKYLKKDMTTLRIVLMPIILTVVRT